MAKPVHLHVADLVNKDSIIAIAADEDDSFDYYLLKITSDGPVVLKDVLDDYGCAFLCREYRSQRTFPLKEQLD